jgi:hypothetical protein
MVTSASPVLTAILTWVPGPPDGQCPHRPLGVVPVGGAPNTPTTASPMNFDHPAERFDPVADAVVVGRGWRARPGSCVSARGEADQVDEDDRDDPPLLRDAGLPPASGRPHVRQNWAIGGFSSPHTAQTVMN